jgi:hypothetical protein
MSKPTVAQLNDRLAELEASKPNIFVAAGTVWTAEQLATLVEKYSRYGELVKMDLTISHSPGKTAFRYIIWHYQLLNREEQL